MNDRPLRVLFVTPEIAPYSKTGGLADISAALPFALRRAGLDIRVITPCYGFIDRDAFGLRALNGAAGIRIGGRAIPVRFLCSEPSPEILPVYLLDYDPLYDRPGVYVDPFSGSDYIDNDVRFIALCRASLELCRLLNWQPDLVHCNDWQTALLPLMIRDSANGKAKTPRTLLTIHNMAFHGLFGHETLARIGGADGHFFPGGPLEFYGKVSFLKAGLVLADQLNTVSPTYAREIQSDYSFGFGLENVLRMRASRLTGVLNGIDDGVWNPETDSFIPSTYRQDSLSRKLDNKRELYRRFGFAFEPDVPLVGMISRISSQKGFEIILPILQKMLELPCRFCLLGSGDPYYEHLLEDMAASQPKHMHVTIGHNEQLAHLIEAGADIFLMPSKYEPCGLNQMMSMRYGTLPVVRATGGLADTVVDADLHPGKGTGFSFVEYRSEDLLRTVARAAAAFRDKKKWKALQVTAMSRDFSWKHSAAEYLHVYRRCLDESGRGAA